MRIWKALDAAVDIVLAATLAVVSLVITTNVILRFAFDTSLMWSGEISGGLLVWITFLGAYRCSRERSHLVIDLFTEHCSAVGRSRLVILRSVIQAISFALLAYLSLRVTQLVGASRMQTVDWPVGIWFSAIFIGFVLLTFSEIHDLVRQIFQRDSAE